MQKIFFPLFKLRRMRNIYCKKNGRNSFFTFNDKGKNYFWISLTSYHALTPLIKIHCQLSNVMRIAVWYFICTRELFSIMLFHRKLAFVLVKFSLWQDENPEENFLPIFVSEEATEAKIWWNQQVQCQTRPLAHGWSDQWSHCF